MAVTRLTPRVEPRDRVNADGVYLRRPVSSDYAAWAQLRARSRSFLTPWEPSWAYDELTRGGYRRRMRRYAREQRDGAGAAFFVFRADDDVLVGGCNLNNIRHGVLQCGSLGYWIGEPYRRHGHTRAAVRALVGHSFSQLGLHRVEAACIPTNDASRRLLESVGFRQEGVARAYLKINGAWRDHVIYALISGDPIL